MGGRLVAGLRRRAAWAVAVMLCISAGAGCVSRAQTSAIKAAIRMKDSGELPGIDAKERGVSIALRNTAVAHGEDGGFPQSAIVRVERTVEPEALYRYVLVRPSKSDDWQLVGAWRFDANGKAAPLPPRQPTTAHNAG